MLRHTILFGCCLFVVTASAQVRTARGKITYITRDAIYTSIGRSQGIQDSSIVYVLALSDTVAKLKVFAVSSKSSACTILRTERTLHIDDEVLSTIEPGERKKAEQPSLVSPLPRDTSSLRQATPTKRPQAPAGFTLRGRASIQTLFDRYPTSALNYSQQSFVVNMTGISQATPLRFEVYATLRSVTLGDNPLLSSQSQNRSRIYRLFVGYDDGNYEFAVGRLLPRYAPTTGYLDGALAAKHMGDFIIGTSFGFEPPITMYQFSPEHKKFSFFGGFQSDGTMRPFITIAYSRTYFQSTLDREFLSSTMTLAPAQNMSLSFVGDVELRSKVGQSLAYAPQFSSMLGSVNYQPTNLIFIGIGMSAWRATYSYTSIRSIPDSLLDQKAQVSPSVTTTVSLPSRIVVSNTYSPRSSSEAFGKEYSDAASISSSNILNQAVTLRVTANINRTSSSETRGYGVYAIKSFTGIADVSFRYQRYRHAIFPANTLIWNGNYYVDVMVPFLRDFTFWGTFERNRGQGSDDNVILTEISYRF